MEMHYFGLIYRSPSEAYDHIIGFDQKEENIRKNEANQVDVAHISNGVNNFKRIIAYLETVEKAIQFKKDLYADALFQVDFLLENHLPSITLLVEENAGNTKVILNEIKDSLPIVSLERPASSLFERLGVVLTGDKNGDMLLTHEALTKEECASVEAFKTSFLFNDLTVWVNTVIKRNSSPLSIKNIAVTAFKKEKQLA